MSAMSGFGTTVDDVILELGRCAGPRGVAYALELQSTEAGNSGIRATIQSISNALRHGDERGLIARIYPRGGRRAAWHLTDAGRRRFAQLEDAR